MLTPSVVVKEYNPYTTIC